MPVDNMRALPISLLAVLLATVSAAQTTAPPPPAPTTTLQAGTQLVVVDVVVQDKAGNPIPNLKPEDFQLTEDKTPQTIRNFEPHSSQSPVKPGPVLPKDPPGIFTDYTPVPPNGTLNILLLDALNTPMTDQSFVRNQLQQFVKHADPGTRIAIFGLANRLILLQGFTADPEILKDVVDHKLIPRASNLLDDPVSGGEVAQPSDLLADEGPAMAQTAANMQQFEAQVSAFQLNLRAQYTLDAFNTLAHYLAAFPGRKNLIWFSGSFPLNILPDASIANPFAVMQLDEAEFRETTNLLTKSQVAVYPIDARGLMTQPMFSASQSGSKYARNPQAAGQALQKFSASQAAEHATMQTMAEDTGGQAFYNTNDLATAVAKAVRSGSDYYTLTYAPTNHKHDNAYRTIRVSLTPEALNSLLPTVPTLAYRRGYFDEDPTKATRDHQDTATTSEAANTQLRSGDAYARAAMSRGAPAPQDILFKARILPASTQKENTAAPGNSLDPLVPAKGPFQRFAVDYAALPGDLTLTLQPDGTHTGQVQFIAYVYNRDGRLLNATGRDYALKLKPETYKLFLQHAFQCHLDISVPDRAETFLRIGIQDVPSNRFGVIEIPTASVSRLPPLAPATAPSTSPNPTTTPSTTPPTPPTTPR
jgi:VWFA-related protein